jgi:hypothetical protein
MDENTVFGVELCRYCFQLLFITRDDDEWVTIRREHKRQLESDPSGSAGNESGFLLFVPRW